MHDWFANFLTTSDGKSDTLLTMSVVGVLGFLGFSFNAYVLKGQLWDPFAFAGGFGGMIAACAGGLGLKTRLQASPSGISTGGDEH